MRKLGAAAVLAVLLGGCAATDAPYIPPSTSTETSGLNAQTPGPTNSDVFVAIERAQSVVGGEAISFETRLQAYTVSVIAEEELHEVTVVGSGIIINTVREVDEGVEEFLDTQVVTLADAVDAAANVYPGRVESAEISLDDTPTYDVVIEFEGELITVVVDGVSADVSGTDGS